MAVQSLMQFKWSYDVTPYVTTRWQHSKLDKSCYRQSKAEQFGYIYRKREKPDVNECTEPVEFDSDDSVKDPDYHPDEDIANNQFCAAMDESEEEENSEDTNVFNNDQEQQSENSEPELLFRRKELGRTDKELRNKGKSYVSEKGKEVKAREMLPLKPCRMKCLEKFMEEDRQKCFEEYWAIGNHDNRLPDHVEEITFYSDFCGGQNRNSIVAAMFSFVIDKNPNIREIHHKFLVSGHTHMECDVDHAVIEREKKRTGMKINHPNDWYQLVRSCKRKKPFKVFVMDGQHFLDFNSLTKTSGAYLMKKVDTEAKIFFKSSLSEEESFRELSIRRRGKSTLPTSLPMIHEGPVFVSAEKKDILEILPLIDNVFHDFYKTLKVDNIPNIDPDLEELDADAENTK
ncbi:hypothetical protein ANN_21155 [Periplaneta americana]|uniref:Uncharacterized protein n=1 Tax=Periplaneta americana TaxID=6978 RepID=A0ABQ8SFV1_PERAM|nr:hypothetical protein ANN_21155 [Periplaneta americana]